MAEQKHFISIWFFIGIQLLIYGLLITGAEIYVLKVPPDHEVVLGNLHAALWWGILLAVLGLVYCIKFAPRKTR